MASEWPLKTLEEVAIRGPRPFAMGPFGSNIKAENYRDSGVPVIRGVNLSDIGGPPFIGSEFVFLSNEKADELSASSASPGDVVFVAQGTVGKVGIVPNSLPYQRYVLSQNLMKATLDSSQVDPHFAFYYFRSPQGQHEILSRVNPTGVPCISKPLSSLRLFRVSVPPLSEQTAIARMLRTLDEKIELNRQIAETAEAIFKAVFKSWFVDFDPVRARAEGRKPDLTPELVDRFPASFERFESEEIPMGWSVGQIGDVAGNPRRGLSPNEIQSSTPYIALEHMPRKSIALSAWGTATGVESGKFAFQTGEILFGKLRPYFHKVGVAPVDGVCSTDILVIRARSEAWFGFVLGHVSSVEFVEHTNVGSTGTKMPRTSWNDMAKYRVVLPPEPLARSFTAVIRPFVSQILNGVHQNRSLVGLRDSLLPKLISGEFRLPDVERIVGGTI